MSQIFMLLRSAMSAALSVGVMFGNAGSAEPLSPPIEQAMSSVAVVESRSTSVSQQPGGSGFLIDPVGLLVTNAHVLGSASEAVLTFEDGEIAIAAVVGIDHRLDIAFLSFTPRRPRPALQLQPALPARGTFAFALGHPLGHRFSLTRGIVSGWGRAYDEHWPVSFLQHDAAINPGSSGGPLLDGNGHVLGMNTATPQETTFDIGIGLAIPATVIEALWRQLRSSGRLVRGFIGVAVQTADEEAATALGSPTPNGLIINGVEPGSPAAAAGMRVGDLIVSIDGQPLRAPRDLGLRLAFALPGDQTSVTLFRRGEFLTKQLRLAQAPAATPYSRPIVSDSDAQPEEDAHLGMTFAVEGGAVIVESVARGSVAMDRGIRPTDSICGINGAPVENAEAARRAIASRRTRYALVCIARVGAETRHVLLPTTTDASIDRPASRSGDRVSGFM